MKKEIRTKYISIGHFVCFFYFFTPFSRREDPFQQHFFFAPILQGENGHTEIGHVKISTVNIGRHVAGKHFAFAPLVLTRSRNAFATLFRPLLSAAAVAAVGGGAKGLTAR